MSTWTPLSDRKDWPAKLGYTLRYRVANDGMRARFVNYTTGIHRLCVFAGDWLIPVDNRDGYEFLEVFSG